MLIDIRDRILYHKLNVPFFEPAHQHAGLGIYTVKHRYFGSIDAAGYQVFYHVYRIRELLAHILKSPVYHGICLKNSFEEPAPARFKLLFKPLFIMSYKTRRAFHYLRRTSVIYSQRYPLVSGHLFIVLFKVKHHLGTCPAEGIYALVVIPDHKYIFMRLRYELYQLVLQRAYVLKLIYQYILIYPLPIA